MHVPREALRVSRLRTPVTPSCTQHGSQTHSCGCALAAEVVSNVNTCHGHYYLHLALADFPASTPGQFVQIQCATPAPDSPIEHEWPARGFPALISPEWRDQAAYLRRPFSIADQYSRNDGRIGLLIVHHAIGKGTRWLERLRAGDALNLTGPLGRGFTIPAEDRPILLVGGGVGIPPLLYMARALHDRGLRSAIAIFGARGRELFHVPIAAEPPAGEAAFEPAPCLRFPHGGDVPAIVMTDDGSLGARGRVTDGVQRWFDRNMPASQKARVLACGPEPMLAAVAKLTRALRLECELCVERMMGCGLGTCLACVARLSDEGRDLGWRYGLTCREGPVFARDALYDYRESRAPCS